MKQDFLRRNDFAVFWGERVKQRNREIEKISLALENALCIVDDNDELLLNIARVMYFFGCRFIKNESNNEKV